MDKPQYSPTYQIKVNLNAPAAAPQPPQAIAYIDYLKQMHRVCKPASYFEIGVETGQTLVFADCPSVAVDPDLTNLAANPIGVKSEAHFFQLKSDDFFARHGLRKFFPNGVDLAFLDGMHLFEFLLRDLMNTEKDSHRDTVVALHDCYPINAAMADRETNYERRTDSAATRRMWTGDVWKLLPILRDYRPDLEVTVLDCPPTGLVIVRRLDAGSKVLAGAYDEIMAKYRDVRLETFGIGRLQNEFPVTDSRGVYQPDAMRRWLGTRPAAGGVG